MSEAAIGGETRASPHLPLASCMAGLISVSTPVAMARPPVLFCGYFRSPARRIRALSGSAALEGAREGRAHDEADEVDAGMQRHRPGEIAGQQVDDREDGPQEGGRRDA